MGLYIKGNAYALQQSSALWRTVVVGLASLAIVVVVIVVVACKEAEKCLEGDRAASAEIRA